MKHIAVTASPNETGLPLSAAKGSINFSYFVTCKPQVVTCKPQVQVLV